MNLRIKQEGLLAGTPEEIKEMHEKAKLAILYFIALANIEILDTEEAKRLYGVSQTPAWINVRNRIKSEGTEPSIEVMREWIKVLL